MSKTYCLLNHELTENQIKELQLEYKSERIIYPPASLKKEWGQLPSKKQIDTDVIKHVILWLEDARSGDTFVIQGEPGTSFVLVDYAKKQGLLPLHAVTKRVESESREGEVVSKSYIFKHLCFREYKTFEELQGEL